MEGYPAIAQIMSNHDELAIFRRFKQLNILNLLYSQAEIIHLEVELESLQVVDKSHPERAFYHRDWWSLANSEEDENKEQWQKVLEIRQKLEAYSGFSRSQTFF
jgi:type I site-specific restriction-modification system R (restriction) subunit